MPLCQPIYFVRLEPRAVTNTLTNELLILPHGLLRGFNDIIMLIILFCLNGIY